MLLQLQRMAGNAAVVGLVGSVQRQDVEKGPAGRTPDEIEGLIEDAFQAVVQNETAGAPTESRMHTAAGPRASFANASQMIAARAVGSLKELNDTELASITTLTRAELQLADTIMVAAGKVWDCIVRGVTVVDRKRKYAPVKTPVESMMTLGPLLTKARLYEADDVHRMFAFREFRTELKAASTGAIAPRKASLALQTDAELLACATAVERRKVAAGSKTSKLPPAQRQTLIAAMAQREVLTEIAGHEAARSVGITYEDVVAYFHNGMTDRFGEDRAAWQRLAISRPLVGVGSSDDQKLESRVRAAAESGGGFRLSRLNMHSHLAPWLAKNPSATDEQVVEEAAFHNFGGRTSKSALAYAEHIVSLFPPIRAARAAGTPKHRGADTGAQEPLPAGPGPSTWVPSPTVVPEKPRPSPYAPW